MISTQFRAINGELLADCVTVPQELLILFRDYSSMPYGLLDYSKETGLVEVALTKEKKCSMKLGRFLKKLSFPDAEVRDYSSRLRAIVKQMQGASITLATTQEEVLKVYQEGPHSCMKNSQAVRVYAGPDTAVAYVEIEGKILARTVVVTNEDIGKQWVRIYGNSDLIEPLLEKEGFVKGDLEGCRLLLIEEDGFEICPYIDGDLMLDIGEEYLIVTKSGEYRGNTESGIVRGEVCEACDEASDETHYSEFTEMSYCQTCFDEVHLYVNGEYYHTDSHEIVHTGDEYILANESVYSEYHNEHFHEDDAGYSDYHEDYFSNDDLLEAYTSVEDAQEANNDTELCFIGMCTYLEEEGFWIEDDFYEDYQNSKQGELDFED